MTQPTLPPVPRDRFAVAFFAVLEPGDERNPGGDPISLSLRRDAKILFPDDEALERAFLARLRALLVVLERAELAAWVRRGEGPEGRIHVHPGLISAAAEVRFNRNGKFPLRNLAAAATELERSEFHDWAWP
jgi:hypothetical protein